MSKKIETLSLEVDIKASACPCGSGKTAERCCGPVKPRTYTVELDPRNYYESDGFALGLDLTLQRIVDGQLAPIIGTPRFEQSYSREKGRKILLRGASWGEHILSPQSLLLGFDHIFFIDTNTKLLGANRVSITGVLHAFIEPAQKEGEHILNYGPLTQLEFWDCEGNPEVIGWHAVIDTISENEELKDKTIALFVDSELGNLDGINERSRPLLGGSYLPENFRLIYASADSGGTVANKLMKLCDRWARDKLQEILTNPHMDSLKETTYGCRLFRQWMQ